MRAHHRIRLQAAQIEIAGTIHRFRDFDRLRRRARAGAVVADVEIHQHVDFAGARSF